MLAQAVCDLWPGTRYAIGPAIEDGFYYDLELPGPISETDLAKIEDRMREIAAQDQPFVREELSRAEALERFADQPYKREIVETLEEGEVAGGETVTVYRNDGWSDLCLGPHVPSTGRLGAFTLTKLAGAYWRGDESRPMLTTDLRHGLGEPGRPRRLPAPSRGGREARPPAPRSRARPVLEPGRARAGPVGLAPEGRDLPQAAGGLRSRGCTWTAATTSS